MEDEKLYTLGVLFITAGLNKIVGAPTLLNKLVPGWDKPVIADTFTAGDIVSFTDSIFTKKYPGKFEVTSVKGKYTYIKVINKRTGLTENVGFASTELKKS